MRCFRLMPFAVLAGLLAWAVAARAEDDGRCGAGRDLMVQALERAGPLSGTKEFEDALQLLKRASAECPKLGDAMYYRSLVEARLGNMPLAKYSADKARFLGSEAQEEGLQPFVLATQPGSGRGFEVTTTASPADASTGAEAARSAGPGGKTGPLKAGAVQQKWALVIGVGKFADESIPKLHYTISDAQAFAALLNDPGVGRFPKANVHTLLDREATTHNIKEQLNWIARHAGPDDIVVIYLATHGSSRKLDSVGGLNYLVTYDTEIKSAAEPDEDALYATALPMVDLSSAVATRVKALRTLVVLDTCYSGGIVKGGAGTGEARMMGTGLANAAPSPEVLKRMSQGSGRIVLAASQADQESLESDMLQHGYFTYFLLKDLRDAKGLTPMTQVFAKVRDQVAERVAADFTAGRMRQVPVMDQSSEEADFAIGVAGVSSAQAASDGGVTMATVVR